jgi:hypothetical protein
VTICVGFCCDDKIIFCADRQMTKGDLKFYETKVFASSGSRSTSKEWPIPSPQSPEWTLGLGYADSREMMQSFQDAAKKAVGKIAELRFEAFRLALESAALDVFAKFPEPDVEILAGVTINTERCAGRELLKLSRHGVREVEEWECLGVGDSSLVRYLAGILLDRAASADEKLALAVYMVKQAKFYVNGCGGDTDVLILQEHKAPHMFSRQEVEHLEERLEPITKEVGEVFKRLAS